MENIYGKIKRISGEQGQGLVEFVVVCSVLLILFGIIADGVNLIQRQMDLNSAATEMTTSASLEDISASGAMEALCSRVLADNYSFLDDGETDVVCTVGLMQGDALSGFADPRYLYHNKKLLGDTSSVNTRNYSRVEVGLSRTVTMLSPVGRVVFGKTRELSAYRTARIYYN